MTYNNQKLGIAGEIDWKSKTPLLQRCFLPNASRDRRFKRAWSDWALCIPIIPSGSPNKRWLHTYTCCAWLKKPGDWLTGSSRRPQKWRFRGFLSLISFLYFSLLSIEFQHWNWRPASWRNFNACFPKWLFWGFVHLEDSGASQFSPGNHHQSPTVRELGRLPCDTRWWWLLKSLDWQIWPLCQRFCYFVLEWEISFFTNGVYCFQFKW